MIFIISCVFPPEPVVSATLSKDIADKISISNDVVVLHPRPTRPDGYRFDQNKVVLNYESITLDSFTCSAYSVMGRIRESYSFGRKCAQYIFDNKEKIDVIYLNAWALFGQYWIIKTAKRFGIPCVIHVQDIYPESFTNRFPIVFRQIAWNIFIPIDKFVLKNSKKVIAISNNMRHFLLDTRKIDKINIAVVHNWQDENKFLNYKSQKETNSRNESFIFMYLGNLGPYSCIDVIINAFSKLNCLNAKLVIAGFGSMKKKLQEQAKKLNTKIEFIDAPNKDVPKIQSSADALLLTVKTGGAKTGMPSKLSAYMFSSKPIIACIDSDSDTADVIRKSNCGWIVEPENVDSLSKKMEEVISMPTAQLTEMGKRGCEYALEHFSRKNNVSKIVQIILDAKK